MRARERPTSVDLGPDFSPALAVLLHGQPEIEVITGNDPRRAGAHFAIENGTRRRRANGLVRLRAVWHARRPRGGTPLTLLERGVAWEGGFHTTPDELRAAVGTDTQFDAFVASHPEVRAWYRSATQPR